ncbi:MAG TPA: hypothetical protein VNL77_13475 [Roseiflexaceae bacterium]|nr:hypothetical protein [Roseiflexaceae bacterium]
MSYFGAQPGKRPAEPEAAAEKAPPLAPASEIPYFTARLGPRPAQTKAGPTPASPGEQTPAAFTPQRSAFSTRCCPLCAGPLAEERGIYLCRGRCGARWIEDAGALLDMAALPYGACACCERPRPLVRGDQGALCPVSGRIQPQPAPPGPDETLAAIDRALRRNSARVAVNGLFDLDFG